MPLDRISHDEHILLLTGIASPRQMIEDLTPLCGNIKPLTFGDHHSFTSSDVDRINSEFAAMPQPKMIVTTEKDATRLIALEGLSEDVRACIYALPVKISFMLEQEESFNEKIIGYVRKNSRNSILAKAKDDNKPRNGNHTGYRSRTISFRDN